jgi:PAS domain S-box-containing protein
MNTFNTYFYHPSYQQELDNSHIFQKIVQLTPYIIHIHRLSDFKLLFANSKLHEILGYHTTDIEGANHSIFFEDKDPLFKENLHLLKENDVQEYESTVLHKNGKEHIFLTRLNPFVWDESGKVAEVLCLSEDITQQRQHIENLRHREVIMSEAENLLKFGSWEWNIEKDELFWSDGVCEIFGYHHRKGLPEKLNSAFYASHLLEDIETENYIKTKLAEKKNYDIERKIRTYDGKEKIIYQKIVLIHDKTGKFTKIVGSTADITENRQFTEKLLEKEALMAEGEYLLNYGSWSWTSETDLMKWSDNMWRILGYNPAQYKDQTISFDFYLQHIHPDDKARIIEKNKNLFEKGEFTDNYEHRVITAKGEIKIFDGKAQVLEYNNNKPHKIVGSIIDITHITNIQKDLEIKINELNRSNSELEQFAYVASHDLQEPLRKIQAFGERLNAKYENIIGDDGKMYLARMTDATIRMKNLIESLLSFSRLSRDKENFEKTNLNQILKQVCSDLEVKIEEKNAIIHIGELPQIEVIPAQISRLFMNLVSNALKFSKENIPPEINIICKPVSRDEKQTFELLTNIEYIQVIVSDNGIGFEQEFSEKIFMLFQRLHGRSQYEGTGMGLAICRKIAENHHGKILAKGNPEHGSVFTVVLPLTQ